MKGHNMGYDMYLENTAMDTDLTARENQLKALFDEACKQRDGFEHGTIDFDGAQKRVRSYYEQMQAANLDYFRLNIWGMGTMRHVMDNLGMLYTGPGEPVWPKRPNDSVYEIIDLIDENKTDELAAFDPREVEAARGYNESVDTTRTFVVGDTPGVMVWKLMSNDNWLVTPAECRSVLLKWSQIGVEERDATIWETCSTEGGFDSKEQAVEWVVEWVAWCERATRCGGFRVN